MKLSCGSQIGNNKELEGRSPVKTLCLPLQLHARVHVSRMMLRAWPRTSHANSPFGALLHLPPDLDEGLSRYLGCLRNFMKIC